MAQLSSDTIFELAQIGAVNGFGGMRRQLILDAVNHDFASNLPMHNQPRDQVQSDLIAMRRAGTLVDGSQPLVDYLRSAVRWLQNQNQSDLQAFQRALETVNPEEANHMPSTPNRDAQLFEWNRSNRQELQGAILSGYSRNSLKQMVSFGLDMRLDDLVTPGPFATQVFELIEVMNESETGLNALLRAAHEYNDGNRRIKALAEKAGVI